MFPVSRAVDIADGQAHATARRLRERQEPPDRLKGRAIIDGDKARVAA